MDLNVKSVFFLTQRLVYLLEAAGNIGTLGRASWMQVDRRYAHDASRSVFLCSFQKPRLII